MKYDGEWKDGLYNGKGTFRTDVGDTIVGSFVNGKANGYGEFDIKSKNVICKGPYVNGKLNGIGT
jgi:hypothetical protein